MTYSFFELNANFQKKSISKKEKHRNVSVTRSISKTLLKLLIRKVALTLKAPSFFFACIPNVILMLAKKKASHSPCLGPFQVQFGPDSTFVRQTVDRSRGSTTAPTTRR